MTLEAAIPEHLTQERTQPSKLPQNYEPPFPAFMARFPESIKEIVMVTIGAQHWSGQPDDAVSALPKLIDFLQKGAEKYLPFYWEPASVTDNAGAYNEVVIAYWQSDSLYSSWASHSGFDAWWKSLKPEVEQHGWFLEIFYPSVDRMETVFSSDDTAEGASHIRAKMSGPISEHVYWGSMRDRLPLSQTDPLQGTTDGATHKHSAGPVAPLKKRISVEGKQNLAVIRSGQNWSATTQYEREKYLETMHPVLVRGMDFLRDQGDEVGCFSNRFMDVLSHDKLQKGTEKTFGYAYFDDLANLEGWSKQHQTHLDIFGRFLQYVKEIMDDGRTVELKLFHEVLVLEPRQQFFEYVGCHPKTGMLAAAQ